MKATAETRPETYFLQSAVLRGLGAIAARLDRNEGCLPFFLLRVRPHLGLEHHVWDRGDMCGRYVDAFILGRQITGCADYREEERCLRDLLHHHCDPFANPFIAGRMLLAFVDEYLQEPDHESRKRVDDLIALIKSRLSFESDYAFFFKAPAGWSSMEQPVFGDFAPYPTYPLGGIVLALSRFIQSVDSPSAQDLLDRLCRFILDASGTFDPEGRFLGHTHSGGILTAAIGILRWAIDRGDSRAIDRMKSSFDWSRQYSSSWGWVPDALGKVPSSSETCSIVDAIHLGLLIARHVDAGYYDIVERYARNQLLENQYLRPDLVVPKEDHPQRDAVSKALYGSWASWSLPNSLDNGVDAVEGCCLGSGIRGCCLVWEQAVTEKAGTVMVNMAFSRDSPWVELISYEPYQGRMDILVHKSAVLRIRIPERVNERDLRAFVDDRSVPIEVVVDHYVELRGLQRGNRVRVEYPLREMQSAEQVSGTIYDVRWRNNTVLGMRPEGLRYPLFQRTWIAREPLPVSDGLYLGQKGGPVAW